jgi:maltooligosyltrehalose trehalohydrolase
MGEEHGETNPFLYFVSHGDPALVETVREGRRRDFEAFAWSGEVPDPQSEETFEASRPGWAQAERSAGARLRALYRDLLRLRRSEAALRPGAAEVRVRGDEAGDWAAVRYERGPEVLEAVFNLSSRARVVSVDQTRQWRIVLTSDAPGYGGSGEAAMDQGLQLPGHTAVLLRAVAT